MALPTLAVWEVRQGGSSSNGGFFKQGGSGTDYSQQTSAQYALTGLTTSAVGAVINTASASADMVDNGLRIQSGTNFTTGWYHIISVVPGVSITVDRNCCTNAASAGVGNVGGALDRLGSAGGGYVPGNNIWVKGNLNLTTNESVSAVGTAALPITIRGYGTVRGDGYTGQDLATGDLFTSNFANYTFSGNFGFSVAAFTNLENFKILAARTQNVFSSSSGVIRHLVVENQASNVSAGCISASILINCEAKLAGIYSGGSPSQSCITVTTGYAMYCRVTAPLHQAPGFLVVGANRQSYLIGCVAHHCLGVGIKVGSSTVPFIKGCTIYGCADGLYIDPASTTLGVITNSIFVGNSGYGINMNATTNSLAVMDCYFRNNTSGDISSGSAFVSEFQFSNVFNTGTNDAVDFVNAAANDFNLVDTSLAVGAGFPRYTSIGALQRYQGPSGQFAYARII